MSSDLLISCIAFPLAGFTAVTKFQLVLTSLVAVIPGAFLVMLLVMALLSHSENLTTIAYVVIGGTLLATSIVVLIPAGILVGGRRKTAKSKAVAGKKETGGEIEAIDDEVAVIDDADGISGEDDLVMETSDFDLVEDDAGMSFEDDLETEPVDEVDSFEIDDDDFDIDDEPKPKKKKR